LKLTFGMMIHEFAPPEATVALLCGPVITQLIENHPSVISTGSVKLTVILASRGVFVPFLRGSLLRVVGGSSTIGVVRRFGFGVPATKSAPFTLVSVKPPSFRKIELVLLGAGAFEAPSRQLADEP
jgi:hypothetical protein